jgi:eukaryotic-like serine/threonine-protein kinase
MDQNEPPPSTGLIAGKYVLVGMIGRGGMGSVWEGRHASLGTRVAIKFIESDYANSTEARQRFDNEAHAAARIQSKHAIQIFDHGVTDDGKPYIVMEFLAGEPLDKRVERMGRLSLQETARILQQVCRGLARAHEQGVIHRDLKPENIFLVRSMDDDEEVAKVLDFGIAKMKGPPGSTPGGSGGVSSSTKTGSVLGTPFYMSPEQARGLKIVDHRTDIWSLGVIAYKCVTGVLPFEGESVGDLLVKICTSPLPVPSQFLPGLPLAFDQWFARALDRDPERRFATVQELSDALAYSAGITVRRGAGAEPAPAPTAYAATAQAGPEFLARPGYTPAGNATPRPRSQPPPAMSGSSNPSYPQAVSGSYAQQASGTSAPFTASAHAPPSSGRGAVIASTIVAAVLALGLGGFVVTKYMGSRGGPSGVAATPPPPTSAAMAVAAPIPAPPPVPALATSDAPDAGAVAAIVTPPVPKPGGHGGRPPKLPPTPKPGGTTVTPPIPLPPTPVPTPPKPANTNPQDPGY